MTETSLLIFAPTQRYKISCESWNTSNIVKNSFSTIMSFNFDSAYAKIEDRIIINFLKAPLTNMCQRFDNSVSGDRRLERCSNSSYRAALQDIDAIMSCSLHYTPFKLVDISNVNLSSELNNICKLVFGLEKSKSNYLGFKILLDDNRSTSMSSVQSCWTG